MGCCGFNVITALKLVNGPYSGVSILDSILWQGTSILAAHMIETTPPAHIGKNGSTVHHGSLAALVDVPFGDGRVEACAAEYRWQRPTLTAPSSTTGWRVGAWPEAVEDAT